TAAWAVDVPSRECRGASKPRPHESRDYSSPAISPAIFSTLFSNAVVLALLSSRCDKAAEQVAQKLAGAGLGGDVDGHRAVVAIGEMDHESEQVQIEGTGRQMQDLRRSR